MALTLNLVAAGCLLVPIFAAAGKVPARSRELVVEAEVVEPGPAVPAPGDAHVIPITRYRVLKVVKGKYADDFLLVGHDPLAKEPPRLAPGVRHRLELTASFPPTSTQLNPFATEALRIGVYYCKSFRPL